MKTLVEIKKKLSEHKKDLKKNYKVKEIGIFGSYARGTQRKKSDVDVLVEFENDAETFDNYMELKFFLEKILKAKVDLVIKDSIKERIKGSILKSTSYA